MLVEQHFDQKSHSDACRDNDPTQNHDGHIVLAWIEKKIRKKISGYPSS